MGVVMVRFARIASDLRKGQVDAEREGFVGEIGLELIDNLKPSARHPPQPFHKTLPLGVALGYIPNLQLSQYLRHWTQPQPMDRLRYEPCPQA